MKKKLTLKEKIFIAFFIYSTVSFLVAVISFYLFREMENIERITSKVNKVYNETLQILKSGQEFFVYETINPTFYELGTSLPLNEQNQSIKIVVDLADSLVQIKDSEEYKLRQDLVELDSLLKDYVTIYRKVIEKVKFRGFKSYGLIGIMRGYIHKIEKEDAFDQELILTLRRYEKDYLLRNDTSYLYKLISTSQQLKASIEDNKDLADEKANYLKDLLRKYNSTFLKIVEVDLEIGYRKQVGLNLQLKWISDEIHEHVALVNQKANERKKTLFQQVQFVLVIIVTFSVILTLLLSISFKYVLEGEDDTVEE